MLTLENLEKLGANTKDGIARCAGNETFYLKIAGMVIQNDGYEQLEAKISEGDLEGAFEAAHTLKGVVGNASLTPIYEPVCEITELLRAKTEMDYTELMGRIMEQIGLFRKLME